MLHWMLLTLSTLMPSLEANIVGGCRLTGAIRMIHQMSLMIHQCFDADSVTDGQHTGADRTIVRTMRRAQHHCAPAAAGRGAPHT